MEVVDYILSGSLVVTFLAVTLVKRNAWMQVETGAMVIFGVIMLLFPTQFLGYMMHGAEDTFGIYRIQSVASILLSLCLIQYYIRSSTDQSVHHCLSLSKIIACGCILITMTRGKADHPELFKPAHVTFGMLGVTLWFLGNIISLFRREFFGTGCWVLNDRLTRQMTLDLYFPVLLCVLNLAHPQYYIRNSTGVAFDPTPPRIYHCHILGSLNMAVLIMAYSAISFVSDEDKRSVLFGRLMTFVIWIPSLVYWTGVTPLGGVITIIAGMLNQGVGVWYRPDKGKEPEDKQQGSGRTKAS